MREPISDPETVFGKPARAVILLERRHFETSQIVRNENSFKPSPRWRPSAVCSVRGMPVWPRGHSGTPGYRELQSKVAELEAKLRERQDGSQQTSPSTPMRVHSLDRSNHEMDCLRNDSVQPRGQWKSLLPKWHGMMKTWTVYCIHDGTRTCVQCFRQLMDPTAMCRCAICVVCHENKTYVQ
ncbi:uncharacterized protein LOC144115660 [Amblyomma americanum]